jgi:PAS domain S-box-containing protein
MKNLIKRWLLKWLLNTRRVASPLYYEYIEAMLADIAEMRQHWRQSGCSEIEIWLLLSLNGFEFFRGVIGLTWARLLRATSIVCYGVEQLLLLSRPVDVASVRDASGLMILTLQGLHQVMGTSGHYAPRVMLKLSPTAKVLQWNSSAEEMFGFTSEEIVGQASVGTFIPPIESGGRSLEQLLLDICLCPRNYSLNLNENQDRYGERFWMLWINVPQYDEITGELIGVLCFGIRTEEPELIRPLVKLFLRLW